MPLLRHYAALLPRLRHASSFTPYRMKMVAATLLMFTPCRRHSYAIPCAAFRYDDMSAILIFAIITLPATLFATRQRAAIRQR